MEFVRRVAALIPPPRKHVVRYYGALGPCSPLRGAVNAATKGRATSEELEAGYPVTLLGRAAREAGKAARKAASAALRSWAACVRKVFEVDPVRCVKCGGEMKLVAVVLDDGELDRILAHEGWPVEFPKTRRCWDFLSRVCAGPEGSRPKPSRRRRAAAPARTRRARSIRARGRRCNVALDEKLTAAMERKLAQ